MTMKTASGEQDEKVERCLLNFYWDNLLIHVWHGIERPGTVTLSRMSKTVLKMSMEIYDINNYDGIILEVSGEIEMFSYSQIWILDSRPYVDLIYPQGPNDDL
jgi:hypothetical protein